MLSTWYVSAQAVLAVSAGRGAWWLTQNNHRRGVCRDGTPRSPFRIRWERCRGWPWRSGPSRVSSVEAQGHSGNPGGLCPVTAHQTVIKAGPLPTTGSSPNFRIPQGITGGLHLCPLLRDTPACYSSSRGPSLPAHLLPIVKKTNTEQGINLGHSLRPWGSSTLFPCFLDRGLRCSERSRQIPPLDTKGQREL